MVSYIVEITIGESVNVKSIFRAALLGVPSRI